MSLQTTATLITLYFVGGSLLVGGVFSYILHTTLLAWIYERMRPKKYREITDPGERIEGVFPIDFWATTFVWLFGWLIRLLLLNFIMLNVFRSTIGGEGFMAVLMYYVVLILVVLQMLINAVYFPYRFLQKEWQRIRVRVVATTKKVKTYALDFNPAALGTGDAPDLLVSPSDMRTAKDELRWSTNPQRLDPTIKIGWFAREIIIPLRGSLGSGWHFWGGGVRSAMLLTYFEFATDRIALIYRGSTLIKIIEACSPRANSMFLRQQRKEAAKADAEIGKPGEDYDEQAVADRKAEIDLRTAEKRWLPVEFDPFTEPFGSKYWDIKNGIEIVPYESGSDVGFSPVYAGR